MELCPVCSSMAFFVDNPSKNLYFIDCRNCGMFEIDKVFLSELSTPRYKDNLYLVSAYYRNKTITLESRIEKMFAKGLKLDLVNILKKELIEEDENEYFLKSHDRMKIILDIAKGSAPKTPLDAVDMLIQYAATNTKTFNEGCILDTKSDYSIFYLKNPKEFAFVLELAVDMGYLHQRTRFQYQNKQLRFASVIIGNKGYTHLEELKKQSGNHY